MIETKQKTCGLFEIMTDIVIYWAKDNKIDIPASSMKDLRDRLSKASKVLNSKFVCKKALIDI